MEALLVLPPADPDAEILVPGQRGARALEKRMVSGIPLSTKALDGLSTLADRVGCPWPRS
jgi:LDH2 family malate/lactate/ureidoglycolate dehydrogenase